MSNVKVERKSTETEEISYDEVTRTSRKSHFELREVRTFRAIAAI